jgi:hypothetical protein
MRHINLQSLRNWVSLFLVVLCLVLNNSTKSSLLIFANLISLVFLNLPSVKNIIYFKGFLVTFIFLPLFIGIINEVESNQILRFLALFLLFVTYPFKVNFEKLHYLILGMIALYLLFMQIGCALQIPLFIDFRELNYPPEQNLWGNNAVEGIMAFLGGLKDVRLPGIYYNPNIMGQSFLILFVFFFVFIFEKSNRTFYFSLFFIFFLSILFTGSRSTMVSFLFINSFKIWPILKKNPKLFMLFLSIPVISILYYGVRLESFRGLNVIGGIFNGNDESRSVKIEMLVSYFRDLNFLSFFDMAGFLLGHLNWDRQFDSDLGYLLSYFGLVGLIAISIYFFVIFILTDTKYRFVFGLFLISLGATLIMNFRFSILFFIILGITFKQKKIIFK